MYFPTALGALKRILTKFLIANQGRVQMLSHLLFPDKHFINSPLSVLLYIIFLLCEVNEQTKGSTETEC